MPHFLMYTHQVGDYFILYYLGHFGLLYLTDTNSVLPFNLNDNTYLAVPIILYGREIPHAVSAY